MAKKRVHEIAKELDRPSKDVLAALKAAGVEVTTASSSVDEAEAAKALGNGAGATQAPTGEVRRAGPEGRGPRILQEAPPPEPPKPRGGGQGGPRQGDRPGDPGDGGPGGSGGGPRGGGGP